MSKLVGSYNSCNFAVTLVVNDAKLVGFFMITAKWGNRMVIQELMFGIGYEIKVK